MQPRGSSHGRSRGRGGGRQQGSGARGGQQGHATRHQDSSSGEESRPIIQSQYARTSLPPAPPSQPPQPRAQQHGRGYHRNSPQRGEHAHGSAPPFARPRNAYSPASGDNGSSASGPRPSQITTVGVAHVQGKQDWSASPILKLRISGFPARFSTKQVYDALSPIGNISRIELIATGPLDSGAWVEFQPPPRSLAALETLRLGSKGLTAEPYTYYPGTIRSPVDHTKFYQKFNTLNVKSLDFGISRADTSMMVMHTVKDSVQVALNLERKKLFVTFSQCITGTAYRFRFELPIHLLETIYKVSNSADHAALVIPFNSPPRFFRWAKDDNELAQAFSQKDKIWNGYRAWYRQTDVIDEETRKSMAAAPVMDLKEEPVIDIGRWTTYRIVFDQSTFQRDHFRQFISALVDHGIVVREIDEAEYQLQARRPPQLWALLREEIRTTHPSIAGEPSQIQAGGHDQSQRISQSTFDRLLTSEVYLSFPLRYQLQACLSNGYLKEHSIDRAFLERLSDTPQALQLLEKVVDKQVVFYDPMQIFGIRIQPKDVIKHIPNHCYWARAVNITPTMMHVASPSMETSNRIIRKYSADSERFIRVKFTDEKTEGPVSGDYTSKAVYDRVARAMKHGIVVAGRYYEFLAFGNSQFRESGAYFYASTESKSADQIRSELGVFTHIKTPAKYGARLGQTLSTTRPVNIKPRLETIPDIERNGFCFTDGVGKISLFMAKMAAQELGLQDAFNNPPSLYQFRLAGYKGVLALDPALQKTTICMRKSQEKFEAVYKGLEIIRASAFATAYFNRQLIIVLSTLGVPDEIFLKKQQEWVAHLELAMADERIAVEKLARNVDMNQTTLTMGAMVLEGFMKARDPFMMSLLHLWRAYNIKSLKEKARIFIEKGAFVLGCVDETATLRGHFNEPQSRPTATREEKLATLPEIFLQITDTKKPGYYTIVEGICILARNPSLHPGDIRIVRAVNVPALNHLKNVVVLPQTGDQDLASMCSGGDLDGDDYLVMWDHDFLPETINELPMDFTPEKPQDFDRPVTIADIADFFVTYMQNNSLGQIANAHLAQADWHEDGVKSDTCLKLAELHSKAVDYPKSGIAAVLDRDLRPRKWPHFMEKKHVLEHQVYRSAKVLGKLFDQVELVDFKPQYELEFDERVLNAFELDSTVLQTAAALKVEYDAAVQRLMAKHGIRTEFEAWSVFVLEHNQEQRDYKFAEEFGNAMGNIKEVYRNLCREAAEKSSLLQLVAAMYTVTAKEMGDALKECQRTECVGGKEAPVRQMDPEHMPLISFPWLFHRELGQIANGHGRQTELLVDITMPVYRTKTKRTDLNLQLEPDHKAIESSQGVTHYGEVLKLDFNDHKKTGTDAEKDRDSGFWEPISAVDGSSDKTGPRKKTGSALDLLMDTIPE